MLKFTLNLIFLEICITKNSLVIRMRIRTVSLPNGECALSPEHRHVTPTTKNMLSLSSVQHHMKIDRYLIEPIAYLDEYRLNMFLPAERLQ